MKLPVELVDLSVDAEIECSVEKNMALELFNIAQRTYTEEDLSVVITLFANPLSQVLFQARLRNFSCYAERVVDPLGQDMACILIDNILALKNDDDKIGFFFEQMRLLKPLPFSQRETIEYLYDSMDSFMMQVVSSRVTSYLDMNPTARKQQVYNALKYQIASEIEEKDLFCQRRYNQLMIEIETYLNKIMPNSLLQQTSFFISERTISDAPDTARSIKESRP